MSAPVETCARLTPQFPAVCHGRVHSVFQRVVNVLMDGQGPARMLALVSPGLPALPDSVCLPPGVLQSLSPGQAVVLADGCLRWKGAEFRLVPDVCFTGKLSPMPGSPCRNAFAACTAIIRCGLHRLPEGLRCRVEQALLEGSWQAYLGLGGGLTPAFDDACVGMAAVYTAMGRPLPPLRDLSVTTDVSARYLQLSQEGYFGEPVAEVIKAIWSDGADLAAAVEALGRVGASSGRDMLYGMRLALLGPGGLSPA